MCGFSQESLAEMVGHCNSRTAMGKLQELGRLQNNVELLAGHDVADAHEVAQLVVLLNQYCGIAVGHGVGVVHPGLGFWRHGASELTVANSRIDRDQQGRGTQGEVIQQLNGLLFGVVELLGDVPQHDVFKYAAFECGACQKEFVGRLLKH